MIDGPAEGLHARLGIAAGQRLPPFPLRWCPRCYAEALKLHGEAYWRRAHQLPGVLICPSHSLPLRNARLFEAVGQHAFIAATSRSCPQDRPPSPEWGKDRRIIRMLWQIARRSARLLDRPARFPELAALTDDCQKRLIAAGLARPSGRLRLKYVARVAQDRLAPLRSLFPEAAAMDWLITMGRTHRKSFSPLQHLLFAMVTEDAMPAAGPMCNRMTKPRQFLAGDPAFETRLRQAAVDAHGLRDAARMVGVDPKTILRQAARLQLDGPWTQTSLQRSRLPTTPGRISDSAGWRNCGPVKAAPKCAIACLPSGSGSAATLRTGWMHTPRHR